MDSFFLSFEWYKRCNWAKNFFPEAKKKEQGLRALKCQTLAQCI